ncbi:MAG: Jag N-terminal domain-containing protein [Actinomycetota bacterium]|nr:Jag N-terminal domain-containing protein [Actinomycetota bacterium]
MEVTAKTVEEAKDQALDQLGVDESEAEFEVLEEPKAGLFGRLRSEARVRARVQPTTVRPKVERGSRRRGRKDGPGGASADGSPRDSAPVDTPTAFASGNGGSASTPTPPGRAPRPKRAPKPAAERREAMNDTSEGTGDAREVGEEFLQGLVGAFNVVGAVSVRELDDGDIIELAVDGDDVGMLIGPRGQTLAAIQELTRTVVQRKAAPGQPRVLVDVGGYSRARREALERFTRDVATQVVSTGVVRVLEPMPPADRKVVHDTVNTIDGVSTSSEGEEPRRRVVITPDGAGA